MIQPPRGFGENPVAIYHDPDLPPSHHYLAAYRWLETTFGAHAVVHLGKHGTLEWLPGKGLGLSAGCAPDAVLGNLPLIYPFIVNDPGEGTQAKRRGHATIIDHLIPPMARADTYGDLARLEQLLDEYATVSALDPAKLPVLRTQIWELIQAAELHHDLELAAAPRRGRVRQLRAARGRLPVRGQGRADPRRAAHPRPRPGRRAAGRDWCWPCSAPRRSGAGAPPRCPGCAARSRLGRPGRRNSPQRKPQRPGHRPCRADPRGRRAGPHRRGRARPARVGRAPAGDHAGRSRLAAGPGRRWCAPRCSARHPGTWWRCWSSRPGRSCRGWPGPPTRSTHAAARAGRRVRPGRARAGRPPAGWSTCCRPAATSTRWTRRPSRPASPGRPGSALADSLLARHLADTGS